jgi:ATP-dependent DNA helicase RecQ
VWSTPAYIAPTCASRSNNLPIRTKAHTAAREVRELEGAGIVYCSTVAECNAVHAALLDAGVDAQRYNGKMSTSDRAQAQDSFM